MLSWLKRSWKPLVGLLGFAALIYIVLAWARHTPTAQVCSKGEYGPPDQCASYDIVSAMIGRAFVFANEHNGIITAFAGIAVATFTAVLWKATERLWGEAERQRFESKRAADAVESQTKLLALQADILEKQKEIARTQFFAEHRPRIVLKSAFFTLGSNWHEVTYELANSGGSPGRIISGFIGLEFIDDQRAFALGGPNSRTFGAELVIAEGNAVLRGFAVSDPAAMTIQLTMARGLGARGDLHFYGRLTYVDGRGQELGVTRVSVFRRRFDPEINAFVRTHSDHEYAD